LACSFATGSANRICSFFVQVNGEYAQDVIRLGDSVTISDQVFAQVTRVNDFITCSSEEGVFGLGFSEIASADFPTLQTNLIDQLRHPMFSMYLDPSDDYTIDHDEESQDDAYLRPVTANSEIVFGGVNQKHYEGCLKWHDVVEIENGNVDDNEDAERATGYWYFKLDGVEVGGVSLPYSDSAIMDSGSTYIVGPSEAIGSMAELNDVACFDMSSPLGPEFVDCGSPFGFDTAAVDCDEPLKDIKFMADGETYNLAKEDLVITIETSIGPLCILRIVSDFELDGWVLGDVFFNSHYAAFDFGSKRLGLARSAKNSKEVCKRDLDMDLFLKEGPLPAGFSYSKEADTSPTERLTSAVKTFVGGFVFIAAVILSILILTRRRQRYHRAGKFDELAASNDLAMGEMELPGIL
jgi:hypothetical protein